MNKFFANLLSGWLPNKKIRRKFRTFLLSTKVSIKGKNNKVIIIKDGIEYSCSRCLGCSIKIKGNNNIIKIHNPVNFINSQIGLIKANHCMVEIGSSPEIRNTQISLGKCDNAFLSIGTNTTIRGADIIMSEKTQIQIGDDCMFSTDIVIRSVDAHTIIDTKNNQILNTPQDNHVLSIGNHCWIGQRVFITKNAKIPNNTIVGACSLVSKKFNEEYTIIAGVPAKVIQTDRDWKRELPSELTDI